jgi:hypothetical protein
MNFCKQHISSKYFLVYIGGVCGPLSFLAKKCAINYCIVPKFISDHQNNSQQTTNTIIGKV